MKIVHLFASLILIASSCVAIAQDDPLSLPTPRPASPGAYQWGVEALRLDRAWLITRGRVHIALADKGAIDPHEDLAIGFDGPLRPHMSETMTPEPFAYHSTMTAGVAAARGQNGKGISGACPFCSLTLHNADLNVVESLNNAIDSGAVVVNLSIAGNADPAHPMSCATGDVPFDNCRALARMEERDVVFTTIAGNTADSAVAWPANFPTALAIGGMQPDGQFWTVGYDQSNVGSSYGPEIKLVAPSRDLLVTQPKGGVYFDPIERCGDRYDSTVGGFVSLPASYSGYGDCAGTSFSGPWVMGIVGLIRSVNPLLTAAQVRSIILSTATRPVAGPPGSNLTFHLPDAEAAVRQAIGEGVTNRVTPVFSLFASSTGHHLFTTSPQSAVAAASGQFALPASRNPQVFVSFGDPVPGYSAFAGRLCDGSGNNCASVAARRSFSVFTTEHSPGSRALVPLVRMSQVCSSGAQCSSTRTFVYATSESGVHDFEAQGYGMDVVEGYVYAGSGGALPNTLSLCQAFDEQRLDHILYAAPDCNRSQLTNSAGETTGGNYIGNQFLGYVPAAEDAVNFSGIWWNANESGWGIHFTHQGGTVFGTLFTYDEQRQPLWLVLPNGARTADTTGIATFSGTLYRTTGSAFDAVPFLPSSPSNVTAAGTMTVTFMADGTATLAYDVNGTHVTKTVARQVFGSRAALCSSVGDSRAFAANYQDLWWNPNESGWGINVAHQDDVIFATLFDYDRDGKALWLVLSRATKQADGSYQGDLYQTAASPFDAQPFVPLAASDVTRVGFMRFLFTDGQTATLTYAVNGSTVTKSIIREVFASPATTCSS